MYNMQKQILDVKNYFFSISHKRYNDFNQISLTRLIYFFMLEILNFLLPIWESFLMREG